MSIVKLSDLQAAGEEGYESTHPDNILEVVSTEGLSLGEHTFSLVVVDGAGNSSKAATVTIKVTDTTAPTAILTVLDANKVATTSIERGSTFYLSAEGSADTLGGEIASYIWTLDNPPL